MGRHCQGLLFPADTLPHDGRRQQSGILHLENRIELTNGLAWSEVANARAFS